jgi:hypothetical protein
LNKPDGVDLARPETWTADPTELAELCRALRDLEQVRQSWPMPAGE